MAVQMLLDCSVNASLTLEELEDFERDFTKLTDPTSRFAVEGRPTINPDLAPLQHQPHNPIQRATKRKRSDDESSKNSVPTTTHAPVETPSAALAPKKRPRAKISGERLLILKGIFAETQFIVGKQRRDLAARLGLTDNQVGKWFEYRRRCLRPAYKRNKNTKSVWLPGHVVGAFDAYPPTICAVSQGFVGTSSPQFSFAPTNFQTNYSALIGSNSSPPLIWQQGHYDASPAYSSYTSNTPSVRQDFRSPGDFCSPNSVGSSVASCETSYSWSEEVEDFLREHC